MTPQQRTVHRLLWFVLFPALIVAVAWAITQGGSARVSTSVDASEVK